jgi:hypothetical protein
VNDWTRFPELVAGWAAGRADAATPARNLASKIGVHGVVLVEGVSDQAALAALAAREGRQLDTEGISIIPMGGAHSVGRFLRVLGPDGLDLSLSGLCDAGEERIFRRALEVIGLGAQLTRAGMEDLGFHVCVADLEDELIRALGAPAVEAVIADEGDLRAFRTFQNQPHQRLHPVEKQLHRFFGTLGGRKERYARALVNQLDLAAVPRPIEQLLARAR